MKDKTKRNAIEQKILDLRKQNLTQTEVGKILGISGSRVGQIEREALEKLGLKRAVIPKQLDVADASPLAVCQLLHKHEGYEDEPVAMPAACKIRANGCGSPDKYNTQGDKNLYPRLYCSMCGWNPEVAKQRVDNGFIVDEETGLRRLRA